MHRRRAHLAEPAGDGNYHLSPLRYSINPLLEAGGALALGGSLKGNLEMVPIAVG